MTPISKSCATVAALCAVAFAGGCPSSDGSCESSAPCREGTFCFEGRCVSGLPAGPAATAITMANGDNSAPAPDTCSALGLPSTWPPPADPQLPSGWALPLKLDGAAAGTSVAAEVGRTITFTVPPGTASVTIHQQGISAAATFDYFPYAGIPNSVVPTALTAPNGATVYVDDLNAPLIPEPSETTGYYGGLTPWSGSYTLPATSRLIDLALTGGQVPPGDWSFQVNDWNAECAATPGCSDLRSGTYEVTVVARPGPYVSSGRLDVAIYLAGGNVGALAARTDPRFRRFVDGLDRILGRAGLHLGAVTYFDLLQSTKDEPAIRQPRYDTYAPCSDLSRLFSLSAPAHNSPAVDGVHLFLVDDICDGPVRPPSNPNDCTSGIVGIDGSIPGPSGLPGNVNSGAAMVIDDILANDCSPGVEPFDLVGCFSDRAAYIAAHEIGHWLGLYHTTEATGELFDPLRETPTCACADCASFGARDTCGYAYGDFATLMHPAWCLSTGEACGGGDNLMFWVIVPGYSVGNLSREQSFVMLTNPAVRQ